MDRAKAPSPGLMSSLEAMIDKSVSAALDRRLGPARDPLSVQVDAAIASALDRRLGLAGVDLDSHIEVSVARPVGRKFGPHGSVVDAQVVFGARQPLQDLPLEDELATAQLGHSDDSNRGYAINKVHAKKEVLSVHSSLPTAKMPQPHEMIIDTNFRRLEASTIKRESSGEQLSAAALIRPYYRNPEKRRSNYLKHVSAQGKALDYIHRVAESSPDDSDEDNESFFVETEDTDQAIRLSPKHRTAGRIEKILTLHRMDEHPESLSGESYNTAEDGVTISDIITPDNDGPSQLSTAKMVNTSEIKEATLFAPRKIDAPADGISLSGTPSPPPRSLPRSNFAIVVNSSPEGNNVLNFSRGLGGASSHETPHLEEASRASTLQKGSRPVDSGQTSSTKAKERLFVEQGGIFEVRDKVEKRGVNRLEIAAEAVAESDESETPRKRKRAKIVPPGYAEGPSIRFLKVFSQFAKRAKNRGYPRVVDLDSFTNESNKQSFTMADIVATILWNYEPKSLRAFLDVKNKLSFSFVRREGDKKKRDFAIERSEEPFGTKAVVGYRTRRPGHLWDEYYEYSIRASGCWDPVRHHQTGALSSTLGKKKIQEAAVELGSDLFQQEVWALDAGVEIVIIH